MLLQFLTDANLDDQNGNCNDFSAKVCEELVFDMSRKSFLFLLPQIICLEY